jgi:glycosyltransferase involved in cell wall biosynthesis
MKVSIITPTLNSAKFIRDCIESVKNQSYSDIEHIIVDGGSVDSTLEIVKEYEGSYNLRVINQKDNGIYDALNKGIENASGEIIAILHSDDLYQNNEVIEKVVEIFRTQKVDSCYGDLYYVKKDDINKVVRYWKAGGCKKDKFRHGFMPPHPSFFVKKEVYEKYGLFDTSYKISGDYELMVRFLYKNSISCYYISEVLVKMRIGGKSNKDLKHILIKMKEDYRVIKKYNVGGLNTLLLKTITKISQFLK